MTNENLFVVAAIADYDSRTAAQRRDLQERLSRIIEYSVTEVGAHPDLMEFENQGDILLITFPGSANIAKILAELPHQASLALAQRNHDMKPAAKLRLRLAFAMGSTLPGQAARTGQAAVEAARLANSLGLRDALDHQAADLAVIITDDLYRTYVMQQFRPDLKPADFASTWADDPEQGSQANAWISVPGQVQVQVPPKPVRKDKHQLWRRLFPPNPNRPVIAAVSGAIVLGGLGLIGVLIASHSSSSSGSLPPVSSPTPPSPSASASGHSSQISAASMVIEYGDWRPGIVVYANTAAASTNVPVIPFNQGVFVKCVAPNESGIQTINKFYLIDSGQWKGTYASANEFTNGGPKGDPADPSIDPAVHPCPSHN
jgi:hypothetical protein